MNIKVKVIAPYEGLRDLVLDLAKEHKNLDVNVEVGDLGKGLEIAKGAENEGYDVVISRGGTATLIRENIMIPVVEIPVSGYDILRSFTLIKGFKGKVGIIGFSNTTDGGAAISTLLDLEISRFTVHHESEVKNAINLAIDSGVEVVLGDVITVSVASQLGIQGILITSGRESVREAFDNVHKVYEIVKRKEFESKKFEILVDQDDRGILLTDTEYKIVYMNKSAKFYIHTLELGKKLTELNSHFSYDKKEDLFFIESREQSGKVVVNKKKIILEDEIRYIYYFISYRRIEQLWVGLNQHNAQKFVKKVELANFGQFIKSSQVMNELIERAKYYATKNSPIWITGEKGTGKDMLAESIHQASSLLKGSFISYSFYDNGSAKFRELLSDIQGSPNIFEVAQGGTLYLEGMEVISPDLYSLIIEEFRKWPNLRLILSSRITIQKFIKQANEAVEFFHFLTPNILAIPPLRDRIEDISDLVLLFLAKYNTKYGKQVVGIKPDALEILKEYYWPYNVEELDQTVGEVVFRVKDYYIEEKHLQNLITKNIEFETKDLDNILPLYIPKNKTLDEIELDIIMQVLKEEKMNQSSTAKRLGINRSTLWRKIKRKIDTTH